MTCTGTLRQVSYLFEAQNHILPSLTHFHAYVHSVYLFTQGRGVVEPERRLEGQQFTKLGRKTVSLVYKL
jgi:hypothetical protein